MTKQNAGVVVKRILDYLGNGNRGSNLGGYEMAASIGVAEWEKGKTLDEVLDAADQDMYASKGGKA